MKMKETLMTTGGVFRCCPAGLYESRQEEEVHDGDTTACPYCGEEFKLTIKAEGSTWVPLWQLEEK